jgi:phospholipid-translocating ATPase
MLNSVLDYPYLLFWNVFWTLCPVIAIGLFDRFIGVCLSVIIIPVSFLVVDADILMAIPELYRFGREGTWYGLRRFSIYMFDGIYQACLYIHPMYTRLTSLRSLSSVCCHLLFYNLRISRNLCSRRWLRGVYL